MLTEMICRCDVNIRLSSWWECWIYLDDGDYIIIVTTVLYDTAKDRVRMWYDNGNDHDGHSDTDIVMDNRYFNYCCWYYHDVNAVIGMIRANYGDIDFDWVTSYEHDRCDILIWWGLEHSILILVCGKFDFFSRFCVCEKSLLLIWQHLR
jgi:hypothetical protein